jgi:hypothetical protein
MKTLLLALALIAPPAFSQERAPRPEDLIQRLTEFTASATSYASRLTPERIRAIVSTVGEIRAELGAVESDRPDAPVPDGLFRLRFRAVMENQSQTDWTSLFVMDGREAYGRCRKELSDLAKFQHAELYVSPHAAGVKVGPTDRPMVRDELCAGIAAQAVNRGVPASRGARIVVWMRAEGSALFVGENEQAVREDCKAQGRAVAAMVRPGAALLAPSFTQPQIVYVHTARTRDPALICTELLTGLRLEATPAASPLEGRELGSAIEALARAVGDARDLKPDALIRAISRVGDLELSLGQK